MTVLLDENFPLGLVRALQADGLSVDHIITLQMRGASDARIRERLSDANLMFLTHDEDCLTGEPVAALVVVSRVRQSRKLADRIQVWRRRPSAPHDAANNSTVRIGRRRRARALVSSAIRSLTPYAALRHRARSRGY